MVSRKRVLCSLQVYHECLTRNKITKEIVPRYITRPLEEVRKIFQTCFEEWKTCDTWKQLRTLIRALMLKNNPGNINKILGIGCGLISVDDGDGGTFADRCTSQHASLLTMRDTVCEFAKQCPDAIKCYIQDPAYTDVDRSVFSEAGFIILEDPQAFLEVDDSTVVFSCAPNVLVRQLIAELARPAIMILNRVERNCNEQQTRT